MVYKNIKIALLFFLILLTNKLYSQNVIYFTNGVNILNTKKINRVFTAKDAYWENGKSVSVCLPGSKSDIASEVYLRVYNQSIKEVQKFWLSMVFQGRAKSPHFFDTEEDMINYVKRNPGSVGVLPADKKSILPSGLTIISI
jgi:hypothetical protein